MARNTTQYRLDQIPIDLEKLLGRPASARTRSQAGGLVKSLVGQGLSSQGITRFLCAVDAEDPTVCVAPIPEEPRPSHTNASRMPATNYFPSEPLIALAKPRDPKRRKAGLEFIEARTADRLGQPERKPDPGPRSATQASKEACSCPEKPSQPIRGALAPSWGAQGVPRVWLGYERSRGGQIDESKRVWWEPEQEQNGHLVALGGSGSGKTELLRVLLAGIQSARVPSLVLDFHGDVVVAGQVGYMLTGTPLDQVGINPLELYSREVVDGGPARQKAALVDAILRAAKTIGYVQKTLLGDAIMEAYGSKGITQDPSTWRNVAPTLGDVLRILRTWEETKKRLATPLRGIIAAVDDTFGDPVFARQPYLSLDSLLRTGVRLNLSALRRPSQILIVDTVLRQVFAALKSQGIASGLAKFRLFVAIDEASLLKGAEILDILIKEARKFGLGLILASQQADDFTSGVRSNAATLVVLKTNLASEAASNAKQLRGLSTQDVLTLTGPGDGYLRDHLGTRRIQVVPLDLAGRTRGIEPQPQVLPLAKASGRPPKVLESPPEAAQPSPPPSAKPVEDVPPEDTKKGAGKVRLPRLQLSAPAPSSPLPEVPTAPIIVPTAEPQPQSPAVSAPPEDATVEDTASEGYQERYSAGRVWIASKTKKPPGPGQITRWAPIVQRKLAVAASEKGFRQRAFWTGVRDFLSEASAGVSIAQVTQLVPAARPQAAALGRVERAFRLRKLADSLTVKIGELRNSGTSHQRPTLRRSGIVANMEKRAENLEQVQASMRGLADALDGKCEPPAVNAVDLAEQNCVPASLEGVETKTIVEEILARPEFPRPKIDLSWLQRALAGTATHRSLGPERARMQQIKARCGDYWCGIEDLGDVAAVERVAAAFKPKERRDTEYALAELQGFKRALAAGIASQEEWTAAREALQRLGKRRPMVSPLDRQIRDGERALLGVKLPGYFPTPRELAARVVREAQVTPGQRVLEPEAGKGDIAEAVRAVGVEPDVIEISGSLAPLLELKGFKVVARDFLAYREGGYDAIVMHPPFEDNADIEHVQHAYELLAPGGRIAAIMGEGAFFRTGKTESNFRAWLQSIGGTSEKLPAGSFLKSDRSTGVASRLVLIRKPATTKPSAASPVAKRPPEPRQAEKQDQPAPAAASCPPGNPSCKLGLLGGVCGLPANLVLPASRGVPEHQVARYCLASAAKLIPSHNPQTFARRKDYPAEVQERRYESSRHEQLKVQRVASELIPALIFNTSPDVITGTPVVTEEGFALGGNGRLMALQLHYSLGATAAKDYLIAHAGEFGFTPEQVASLSDPVVVRVIDTGADKLGTEGKQRRLQQLVRLLNVSPSNEMDAKTNAVALARQLDAGVLATLGSALEGDVSLAEYLSSRQSQDLAKQLQRVGIINEQNRERFFAEGVFTDDGKRLVEKTLAATMLPNAELLDALGEQVNATLARGAPALLSASHYGEGWDLRPALLAAARDYLSYKRTGAKDLKQFLRQETLIPGEGGLAAGVSGGVELLQVLAQLADAPLKFSKFARWFLSDASSNSRSQSSLFAAEEITPRQAIRRAAAQVGVTLLPS